MPWKSDDCKSQRWSFVQLWNKTKNNLSALCKQVGISRKTAHKWIVRFNEGGRKNLGDQSRAPTKVHNRPSRIWLARIRRHKASHPFWGAPKIHWLLKKHFGSKGLPSEATISRWMSKWKLTRRAKSRRPKGPIVSRSPLTKGELPNEVWTIDFKGWFRSAEGIRVEVLTIRDEASKYLLAFELLKVQCVEKTQEVMERLFVEYGLPQIIRSDNGSPFGSTGVLGLTRLSAWWLKLGIKVEFMDPASPGQNAGHEQTHGIYKKEIVGKKPVTFRVYKRRTKYWVWEYNNVRPHEGIGMEVPRKFYRKSKRKMPAKWKPWTYGKDLESRLIKGKGMIALHGRARFIGEAFEGERVGLKRNGPCWDVYFGPHFLGQLFDADPGGIRGVTYERKRKV